MMLRSHHSKFLRQLVRLPAILSLLVVLFGKPVHFHQECGCCAPVSSTSGSHQKSVTCPFGCDHHCSPESPDSEDKGGKPHDSQHCSVCSQLAQAPDVIAIVDVPCCEDLREIISAVSEDETQSAALLECSRGPPVA